MAPQRLGLIAGNGKFPILFAQQAKLKKIFVVAAAIKGDTSIFLKPFVNKISWFKVGELEKLFIYLKENEITQVIMAGQVNPAHLFNPNTQMDPTLEKMMKALIDRKADTIFLAVAEKLKQHGLELIDSTFLLADFLAPKGTLSRRGPKISELDDIQFGKDVARAMGGLDVGQTVVVKNRAILAIEAMEGTDRTIVRGGKIARGGAVVVKMSKPHQDMRFDVPVIGPRTIQKMIQTKAGCLAIEAQKTLIIDRDRTMRLANKAGICVVACY